MLDRQQAVAALKEMLAAFQCLDGLGGASLRARRGLASYEDRDALKDWGAAELADERRKAQTELDSLLDEEVRSGLEDLLYRVSAVKGLPSDDVQVQQQLVSDYSLSEVEWVRPLLREVARLLRPGGFRYQLGGLRALDESQSLWRPYDLWNDALTETVFNKQHAGHSVYLDIEPDVIQDAAEAIWPPIRTSEAEFEAGFRRTVRHTCVGRHVGPQPSRPAAGHEAIGFDAHADRVITWRGDRHAESSAPDEPPPSIALLAICSLAAERMQSDDDKAASNYYGRLAEVLELPEDRSHQLGTKYREHALLLWESLNVWLRELHGQRGLPTAVSFGHHRYISLPISQALIRAHERDRLSEFFDRYQFNPGQQVARDDMQVMLGRWIPSSGASGLKSVWARGPDMRRRIADVVCTELEHWAGEVLSPSDSGRQRRSLLIAATWYEEPEAEFDAYLCVRSSESEQISGEYRTDNGIGVRALRDPDGLVILNPVDLDPSSDRALVDAALDRGLRLEHETLDLTLSLDPQRIIVLIYDQLRQVYIQSAHSELGRDMLLLVDKGLSKQLREVLDQSAEEGFRSFSSEVHGLSGSWTLFTDVRLHSLPMIAREELQSLRPLSQAQVEFEGGVQLTGGRWHAVAPPSVNAVDGRDRTFTVRLHSLSNLDQEPLDFGRHARQAQIALANRGLADGDYRIVLSEEGGSEITSRALKLRSGSSAHLDPPLPESERLAYATEPAIAPHAALSAAPLAGPAEDVLSGAVISQRSGLRAVPETSLRGALGGREDYESKEEWLQRVAGSVTEEGLEEIERLQRIGLAEHRNGRWEITEAGNRYLEASSSKKSQGFPSSASHTSHSPLMNVDLELILDALAVIGAGSWNAFRRLIDHSDEERYKPHEALRTLRALGYLDVAVDPRSAAPQRWSLSPPALLALPTRESAVLTGRRTPELLKRLQQAASAEAIEVVMSKADGRPARVQLDAEHAGTLQNLATAVGIPLIFDLPRRILERMPPIYDILAAQPELLVPEGCSFERFDRATNNWHSTEASDARLAGAYRIRFPTGEQRYAVWADGVWRECGNATAKYAGAAAVGEHIMAYDEERQELTCLFGARPPGLFERALVLCSGELPHQPGDHRWIYSNVPDNVHRWIAAKLGPVGWRR